MGYYPSTFPIENKLLPFILILEKMAITKMVKESMIWDNNPFEDQIIRRE